MKKLFYLAVLLICLFQPVAAQGQSWCGIQTLYFQHNESTSPAGYEELINYPSGNSEVDESVSVINTGGPILIDNYIMPDGALLETTGLLEGLRRYTIYSYVSSNVGTTQLNFTAFRRFSNGTEQNFYTAMSGDIDALSVTEYTVNYVSQVPLALNPTDRLGIRVSANTSHSSPIIVHWVYQGTSHASNFMSGYFVCEEPTAIQNITYTQSENNATPLNVALLVAIIGMGALLGSLIFFREVSGVILAIIAPFPLIVAAWQFMTIDVVTSYGAAAISTTYELMENHTIYTIYPVSIIMMVMFGISVLNIYRIVMASRVESEEED